MKRRKRARTTPPPAASWRKKGSLETLRFLESKSGARENKIAELKHGLVLAEQARAAQQAELREALREKLLAASLLEKDLQYEKAEALYRAVIADDERWAEPRNALAWLLTQRGETVEPTFAEGNEMGSGRPFRSLPRNTHPSLRHGQTLRRTGRATQNNLGNALDDPRRARASGARKDRRLAGRGGHGLSRGAGGLHARAVAAGLGSDAEQPGPCARGPRRASGRARMDGGCLGEAGREFIAPRWSVYNARAMAAGLGSDADQPGPKSASGTKGRERAERNRTSGCWPRPSRPFVRRWRSETRERLPQDWAKMQNNLAHALAIQSERAGGGRRASGCWARP